MRVIAAIVLLAALVSPATAAPGLITARQIKPGTITGRQIRAHAIGARELAAGLATPGPTGTPGLQGPTGASGPAGPQGPGTSYTRILEPLQTVQNSGFDSRSWTCPHGVAINGGVTSTNGIAVSSSPSSYTDPASGATDQSPDSWTITATSGNASIWQYHPWIVCAS